MAAKAPMFGYHWLLRAWRVLPLWLQKALSVIIRPRFGVAVAAIIFDEQDRILLFEHTYRRGIPWGLPVGSLEAQESPEQAIQREVHEETSMNVQVIRLLQAYSDPKEKHISLIYECRITSGVFHPSAEVSQIAYYDRNSLPPLVRTEKELLEKIFIEQTIKTGGTDELA